MQTLIGGGMAGMVHAGAGLAFPAPATQTWAMRIIAGTHRGRPILPPEGERTRPITDRVKQSLFDRLASAGLLESAVVLDVFAGTGSLGLECLSRGASHVTFIELDRSASQRLEQNLATLGEAGKSRIVRANALSNALAQSLPRRDYTLLFMDPPYAMVADRRQAPRLWRQMELLAGPCAADAWMVLRVERHQCIPPISGWSGPESFDYGSMTLHIFRHGAC
jgi:16S rRNA (guanine966-N2)-methyltransferase